MATDSHFLFTELPPFDYDGPPLTIGEQPPNQEVGWILEELYEDSPGVDPGTLSGGIHTPATIVEWPADLALAQLVETGSRVKMLLKTSGP